MRPRLRKILAQVGSFALAAVLLYLALRGVDFSEVGEALREAHYVWLLPLALITLLSHLLRAWRWQVLLETLPPETPEAPPKRVSLRTAFYSLMIGYMVNYAAPRAGEFVRAANLAKQEKLRFSYVLGTVAVERILDVVVLVAALVSVFVIFFDRLTVLRELFITPILNQLGEIPALVLVLVTVGVAALVFSIYRWVLLQSARYENGWVRRLGAAMASFKEGLRTLIHTKRPVMMVFSTLAIWFCYVLMAYLPLVILRMTEPYHLSLLDAWGIMVLGAVGVAIPSPGGMGSYHYITIETLTNLFGVPVSPAASYAILSHAGQLLLYVAVGFASMVLQGASLRALKETAETVERNPS
ncbi:lysylphosphatidylglycerol synthase transmembrane domain-containing protein [Rhodocaloribacter sp.]